MRTALLLVPAEFVALMLMAGGLALVVGAKKLGTSLLVAALALAVLPAMLAPFFSMLPDLMLTLILIAMGVALVFGLLRWMSNSLIGTSATNNMIGILAADVVRGVVVFTFRLLTGAFRATWRILLRLLRG